MWNCNVITMYPEMFPGSLSQSISGRALRDRIWDLNIIDLKEFGIGNYKKVDDSSYGGGAGMVIRPDVASSAIDSVLLEQKNLNIPLIYLSPKGESLKQSLVNELSMQDGVNLFCGHFEGLDERVIEYYKMLEVSVGDYILTGGEIASFVLIDSCVRMLNGSVGNKDSLKEESFSDFLLEYPHYTRPSSWRGYDVPDVLLSGNHKDINAWRRSSSERLTEERRKDLWHKYLSYNRENK